MPATLIRIDRTLYEQAKADVAAEVVEGAADLTAKDSRPVITLIRAPRAGWTEAAAQIAARSKDDFL